MLVLVSQDAPNRTILCAGAGTFEAAHITMTQGVHIGMQTHAPEDLASRLADITRREGDIVPLSGAAQGQNEVQKMMAFA
jgi:hypothetical protein